MPKYQVANPRGLPEGTRILATEDGKEFREGDAINPGDVKTKKDFADLVKRGFVVDLDGSAAPDDEEGEEAVEAVEELAAEPEESAAEPEVTEPEVTGSDLEVNDAD